VGDLAGVTVTSGCAVLRGVPTSREPAGSGQAPFSVVAFSEDEFVNRLPVEDVLLVNPQQILA
jgi:hypothetical protein